MDFVRHDVKLATQNRTNLVRYDVKLATQNRTNLVRYDVKLANRLLLHTQSTEKQNLPSESHGDFTHGHFKAIAYYFLDLRTRR